MFDNAMVFMAMAMAMAAAMCALEILRRNQCNGNSGQPAMKVADLAIQP